MEGKQTGIELKSSISNISGHEMDEVIVQNQWVRFAKIRIPLFAFLALMAFIGLKIFGETTYNIDAYNLEITSAKHLPFRETLSVNAGVEPLRSFIVTAKVSGTIQKIYAFNGDLVDENTPILTLVNPDLELEISRRLTSVEEQYASVQSARMSIESEKFKHKRTVLSLKDDIERLNQDINNKQTLADEGFLPKRTIDELKNNLVRQNEMLALEMESFEKLQALRQTQLVSAQKKATQYNDNLKQAKRAKQTATVRAANTGQLIKFDKRVGANISTGEVIAEIQSLGSKKIKASVDEYYLSKLAVGQQGDVFFQGKTILVKLTRLDPNVNSGRFTAEWELFGEGLRDAKIGQTVKLKHYYSSQSESLLLPLGDFYISKIGDYIFVISDNNIAQKRLVEFGRRNDEYIEVVSGLQTDERVIISDYSKFNSFEKIRLSRNDDSR